MVPSKTLPSATFSTEAKSITISISGSEYITSTILIRIMSTLPPTYPAIEPIVIPITKTMILAKKPTASEILVPYTTRIK